MTLGALKSVNLVSIDDPERRATEPTFLSSDVCGLLPRGRGGDKGAKAGGGR
jgi:hypothetical protein